MKRAPLSYGTFCRLELAALSAATLLWMAAIGHLVYVAVQS